MQIITLTHYPLREKMQENNWTIRELAIEAGVHYTFISRLLTGKSNAKPETAQKIISTVEQYKNL